MRTAGTRGACTMASSGCVTGWGLDWSRWRSGLLGRERRRAEPAPGGKARWRERTTRGCDFLHGSARLMMRFAPPQDHQEDGRRVSWPTSIRWPSGSLAYARISTSWFFGSERNSTPLADQSRYTAWMSATRTFRKALVRLGSAGVVSVTVGLSSVGPPPTFRMSHELATFMMTGSRSRTIRPPN